MISKPRALILKHWVMNAIQITALAGVTITTPSHAGDAHDGGDHTMGAANYGKFMLDKFEAGDDNTQHWDAQAWYGSDRNRLWLKSAGTRDEGHTGHAELQTLYSRAISPFFDAQIGVRHDLQPHPSRDWLVLGLQGLAPYFFDTEATLFIGESGRSALRLKAEHDLLLTQRLILSPELEANFYGEDDAAAHVGSGLSDLEFGVRLRYEIQRELAPYIGVAWSRQFGDTADLTRARGEDSQQAIWLIGVRAWF
jgi:copper resistance protein B